MKTTYAELKALDEKADKDLDTIDLDYTRNHNFAVSLMDWFRSPEGKRMFENAEPVVAASYEQESIARYEAALPEPEDEMREEIRDIRPLRSALRNAIMDLRALYAALRAAPSLTKNWPEDMPDWFIDLMRNKWDDSKAIWAALRAKLREQEREGK